MTRYPGSFCLIILVITFAAVYGKSLLEVHDACQSRKETFVDEEVFRKIRQNEKVLIPSNFGDHMFCMSKEAGFQKEDGALVEAAIRQKIEEFIKDKTKVDQLVELCAVEKDNNAKTANDIFKCLRSKAGISVRNH